MMRSGIGQVLRRVGLLIEVVCVALRLAPWTRGQAIAGVRIETLLLIGFGIGLLCWIVGILLMYAKPKRPRDGVGGSE